MQDLHLDQPAEFIRLPETLFSFWEQNDLTTEPMLLVGVEP